MHGAPEPIRPEQVGGLEKVTRDELQAGDEDDQHQSRRAPGLGDDDSAQDAGEVVEREPEHRLVDHAGVLQGAVQITPLGEDREPKDPCGQV